MTDAQIDALLAAARTGPNDLVTWAEMTEILQALRGQVSLTDLGTPVDGKVAGVVGGAWAQVDQTGGGGGLTIGGTPVVGYVPKWTGTGLVWAADDTASGGTGWDSNGTLTANRTVTENGFGITFRKTAADTVPNITVNNTYSGTSQVIYENLSPTGHASGRVWQWVRYASDNGDGTFNEVMKWGFNIDRIKEPTKNGMWYAIEPHWITGGELLQEFHLSMNNVGDPGEKRLFSHTFQNDGLYADSIGVWDFRTNRFHVKYWDDNDFFVVSTPKGGGAVKMTLASTNGTGSFTFETNGAAPVLSIGGNTGSTWNFISSQIEVINFNSTALYVTLPTFANDAAAFSLAPGRIYKTSTGELRIKL